jgi:acetyltransferase-like isoleucine patch superfamily enzyme
MIAPNCAFYPHDHGMAPGQPIRDQPLQTKGPIIIGDNVWVGAGVVVLGGVEIGEGAVIGAGSVVTTSIPGNAVAVGSPAKVVKFRSE